MSYDPKLLRPYVVAAIAAAAAVEAELFDVLVCVLPALVVVPLPLRRNALRLGGAISGTCRFRSKYSTIVAICSDRLLGIAVKERSSHSNESEPAKLLMSSELSV